MSCSFVKYQLRKAGEPGFDLTMLYFERDLSWTTWSSLAQCENEMHALSSVTIHINSRHLCFVVGTWLSKDAGKRVSSRRLRASSPYSLLGGAKKGPLLCIFKLIGWGLAWGRRSERKIAVLISTLFLPCCCFLSPFWISPVLPWQRMSQNGKWNMQKT